MVRLRIKTVLIVTLLAQVAILICLFVWEKTSSAVACGSVPGSGRGVVGPRDDERTIIISFPQVNYTISSASADSDSTVFLLLTPHSHSSSVQNMVIRYILTEKSRSIQDYDIALPRPGSLSLCYPQLYTRSCWNENHVSHFDFLFYPLRYNHDEVTTAVSKNTKKIMLIRHPVSLVLAAYHKHGWGQRSGVDNIHQYFNKTYKKQAGHYDFANKIPYHNIQVFLLGVDLSHSGSHDAVKSALEHAVRHFDLVMLHERLWESLVLLRLTLDWDYEDLVTFVADSETEYSGESLTADTYQAIVRLNNGDMMLYDLMSKRFDERVKAVGETKMEAEMHSLKTVTEQKKQLCLDGEQSGVPRTELRLSSQGEKDEYCRYSVSDQLSLTETMRNRRGSGGAGRRAKPAQGLLLWN